jgi:hypothetical protein
VEGIGSVSNPMTSIFSEYFEAKIRLKKFRSPEKVAIGK